MTVNDPALDSPPTRPALALPDSESPVAPPPPPVPPDRITRVTRAVAFAAWLALIVLGLAWELIVAPTGHGTLALKVLPLLPAAMGLLRFRLYTFRWLSLLVWLYVAEGLVRAASDRGVGALLATAEVLLALLLFTACVVHIRWRLRGARPGTPAR
jgi:uncharacterized membrane protein